MKPTYRKSCAANLLMWSDVKLDPSFKVKRGFGMVNQHIEIMGWESSGVVGFDLGPHLQSQ